MEVKGTILQIIPVFIKEKFGEAACTKWLDALPEGSRKIFAGTVLPTMWYPFKESMLEPTKKLCEFFFNGNNNGAAELGRFSAEKALKGIYKMFIKLGSPDFIVKRAGAVISTYYRPVEIDLLERKEKSVVLSITKFDDMHELIEQRILGWVEKAIELSNTKKPKVELIRSLTKNEKSTDYRISWE